jgi:hypothetical protein
MYAAATGIAIPLAQKPSLAEFFRDPSLTVACVLLIVVSVGWIIVTRLIVHQMKRAAKRGVKGPALDSVRGPRDIWQIPP